MLFNSFVWDGTGLTGEGILLGGGKDTISSIPLASFTIGLLHKRAAHSSTTMNIDLCCPFLQVHQLKLFCIMKLFLYTSWRYRNWLIRFKCGLSAFDFFFFTLQQTQGSEEESFIPTNDFTDKTWRDFSNEAKPLGSAEVSQESCEPRTLSTVNWILCGRTDTGLWSKSFIHIEPTQRLTETACPLPDTSHHSALVH